MNIEFNTNIELLSGGFFCGHTGWNKSASSIDNCFKLYRVRKGCAIISDANSSITLEGGKIYFINGYKLESQKCLEPFTVEWIHFLPKSLYLNYVFKQGGLVTELCLDDFNSFMDFFRNIKPLFENKLEEDERKYVLLEIQALVQFTISKTFRQVNHSSLFGNELFLRILPSLEYIADNYKTQLSLNDVAEKCHLSPNYFHRIFNNIFDMSPLKYIQNLRMDEAIRQLVYTSQSVKQVAYNIGYDDEAYFSRVFSKIHGTSPGVYRKKLNEKTP